MGVTLGVLMEGGVIPWGGGPQAIEMVKKVPTDDAWGRIIGNGSVFTGQALGVDRVPAAKRQGLPAYDPRASPSPPALWGPTTPRATRWPPIS
jgi:aldehyde:ferredoxin oxidoreductase